MEAHSVSKTAEIVKVNRRTLQRWVQDGLIPVPKAMIIDGQLVKAWDQKEIAKIRKFKAEFYGGKGMDRRKGSRAKQRKG